MAQPMAVMNDGDEDDWQVREDAHTLARAEAIKANPERHARVKRHIARMVKAVKGTAQGERTDVMAQGYRRVG